GRAVAHLCGDVGGGGGVLEGLQPAGQIVPGPFEVRGDVDRADHAGQSGGVGGAGGGGHAAVPDHLRGHSLGDPALVARVGEQAEVGVGVDVHEPRGDDMVGAVDDLRV